MLRHRFGALALVAALAAAACGPQTKAPDTAAEQAAAPASASEDVRPLKLGALDLIALRDGGMTAPNDNKILGVGKTPEDVAAVLTANGLPGTEFSLSIQPLLVKDGARTVLIDAGAGVAMGDIAGKLPANLAAAGVAPGQVTDVLISHSHGDHVGGLIDAAGGLTFPNATIRMTEAEWAYLKTNAEMKRLVDAIAPKVETFKPGAVVTPSITAVPIDGHTPGHTGYEVVSGTEKLLYIGDTMHHYVVSVQRPEFRIQFDGDAPTATASRIAVIKRGAAENLRIYAVHFPFPGIGKFVAKDGGYAWAPES